MTKQIPPEIPERIIEDAIEFANKSTRFDSTWEALNHGYKRGAMAEYSVPQMQSLQANIEFRDDIITQLKAEIAALKAERPMRWVPLSGSFPPHGTEPYIVKYGKQAVGTLHPMYFREWHVTHWLDEGDQNNKEDNDAGTRNKPD